MRAKEFIREFVDRNNDGIPDNQQAAAPGMRSHHNLDNSSPYAPWRFAAHFLAGADGKNPYEHEPAKQGPNGQALVTVSYTPEERAMVKQAEQAFGIEASPTALTPDGSSEVGDTYKVSPVATAATVFDRKKPKSSKKK
jgi:hypothetical protein